MRPGPRWNPPSPWAGAEIEWDGAPPPARVELVEDATREILSSNDSPDVPFRWSVNPYRGCMHACAYCYARPTHEYLGMGAGTDFDTRIVVKRRAPALLRAAFERPSWRGEAVAFSGATDAWQPLEAELRLTRGCLEVCAAYRNPVCLVSKSALLERDLDLLRELGRTARLSVAISLPFLDPALARALEPWAPSPARRLRTLAALAQAGLSPGVLVAPVVPGLDHQVPGVLAAAREAGAAWGSYALLRLPGSVGAVFEARLRAALPASAERILRRVDEVRGGGRAQGCAPPAARRGAGPYASVIAQLFARQAARVGLATTGPALDGPTPFRRPSAAAQLALFRQE